ncbi:carbohydrate ABC transporter permease [Paenibacillus sp. IB182496]|uniref:Carbohydrate ABC transporter permease n=1 Tax=Paenibacillus sabuli TaxID=2772509 RepID=A0A927BWC7_9BACL|nr:carbohydrate ABC transporter permease [Paenibacillus sabuli]MBD2846563.1 carbohydrate ABC transporter permease [Paenibacillus sabuli]
MCYCVLVTSLLAYPLSKQRIIGRRFFLMLIAFTLIFNGGLIPTFLVVQQTGLINTTWAMVIPTLVTTFYFFIMKTFFEGLPEELEDAAKIDGSNYLGILLRIVLPLSMPVMATIGLFIAVGQWNSFFDALIYLNDRDMFPLQIHLRNIVIANSAAAQTEVRDGEEMIIMETVKYATIMFATLPILFTYPFIQKYFVQGAMIGSVKG